MDFRIQNHAKEEGTKNVHADTKRRQVQPSQQTVFEDARWNLVRTWFQNHSQDADHVIIEDRFLGLRRFAT